MPGRRAYTTPVPLDELFEHAIPFPFPQGEGHPGQAESPADAGEDTKRKPANPLPATGGVYLLTDEGDRVIQLASAGNLRRALQVRLTVHPKTLEPPRPDAGATRVSGCTLIGPPTAEGQPPTVPSRRRADLKQIVRKIRWREAHSAFEISYEYWRLARGLLPETYLKQLGFGPAWFVHVDAEAESPRFVAGKVLRSPPGVDLGPFFTNADATRFVQVLEDGFDLCRYCHILEQAPQGTACAYFDMGKCPAPCDGSIPMAQYRRMIAAALALAGGDRQPAYQQLEAQMSAAAGRQEYEQAGRLKQRLDRLCEIEHRSFALARPIEQFNYLIVQRGGGRTRVRPFFVRAGIITPGEVVALKKLEAAAEQWVSAIKGGSESARESSQRGEKGEKGTVTGSFNSPEPVPVSVKSNEPDQQARSEQIWLVTHFLGKKDPPGLFIRADEVSGPADLGRLVGEHFAKPEKMAEEEPPADPSHDRP